MNDDLQMSDEYILPLFNEIYVVKERDFSIEYHPLGQGKQKLLLLVSSHSEEFLENNEMQLLNTIIEKGLRRTLDDVWIVNINRFPDPTLNHIWDYFQPSQVIIWGCADWIKKQDISSAIHQPAYINGSEVLFANSLNSYLTDTSAKGKLWSAMQRMFFN
jgi:hypothetical protein